MTGETFPDTHIEAKLNLGEIFVKNENKKGRYQAKGSI